MVLSNGVNASKRTIRAAAVAGLTVLALTLSACGGAGGADPSPSPSSPSSPATPSQTPSPTPTAEPTKLADLGLMGEYLDGLPYRSKILDIDQQLWSSWSISQQQAFLDEVQRKLRLYQIYHDDVDRWVALDGGADPGEAVYPVPLDALP